MGRKKTPKVESPLRYGVCLRDRAIVRFRYPESASVPGEGDNREVDGEIRLASHIFAVMGKPGEVSTDSSGLLRGEVLYPYAWNEHSYNSAHHIANVIGGRVVFLTDAGVEEIDMYKLVAGSPEVRPKGSLQTEASEELPESPEQAEFFE